jgi:hypothetical protein
MSSYFLLPFMFDGGSGIAPRHRHMMWCLRYVPPVTRRA